MRSLNDAPVFVAGIERTGTSLMYALLTSHSQIAMTRRTNFWRHFVDQYGDLSDDENLDRCLADMRQYKRLVALDVDFDEMRTEFVAGADADRTYHRLYALMERQVASRAGKPRWGDKSLNTERYTDALLEAYPRAKILHMIRDPRDRLASVVTRWGSRRSAIAVGTASWTWSAGLALANSAAHPDSCRIVRYETLVSDPEREIREICEFIGEEYEPTMLTMAGSGLFRDRGSNSSYGARAVGEITTTSLRRYRQVFSPREIALIQDPARDAMAALGYDCDPVDLAPWDRLRIALFDRPSHAIAAAAWRSRERVENRRGRPLPDYRRVEVAA